VDWALREPTATSTSRDFWRRKILHHHLHPFAHSQVQFHPQFLGSQKFGFSGHGFMAHEEAETIIIILIY
jgi:hypothetical protein